MERNRTECHMNNPNIRQSVLRPSRLLMETSSRSVWNDSFYLGERQGKGKKKKREKGRESEIEKEGELCRKRRAEYIHSIFPEESESAIVNGAQRTQLVFAQPTAGKNDKQFQTFYSFFSPLFSPPF